MEGMVSCLNQYGGDIIKFVGDAMIVMWPPIDKNSDSWKEDRLDCVRRALQCTLEIQKSMNNMQIMPGLPLSVKVSALVQRLASFNFAHSVARSVSVMAIALFCTLEAFSTARRP